MKPFDGEETSLHLSPDRCTGSGPVRFLKRTDVTDQVPTRILRSVQLPCEKKKKKNDPYNSNIDDPRSDRYFLLRWTLNSGCVSFRLRSRFRLVIIVY